MAPADGGVVGDDWNDRAIAGPILPGNEATNDDGKRLPVRLLFKASTEPREFIFRQEWHPIRELHFRSAAPAFRGCELQINPSISEDKVRRRKFFQLESGFAAGVAQLIVRRE
jgi:hypothetical protein